MVGPRPARGAVHDSPPDGARSCFGFLARRCRFHSRHQKQGVGGGDEARGDGVAGRNMEEFAISVLDFLREGAAIDHQSVEARSAMFNRLE